MAPPAMAAPPLLGRSSGGSRNRTAEALHAWCTKTQHPGYVFSQEELLAAGIIPDQDLHILLSSVQHLVSASLFRVHDRAGGTIGWELVDQEKARNYAGLSRDERLVLQCVDGAQTSGIWTRTIKNKTQLHTRVLDRVYKTLEARGLIRSMKNVNHPSRKMYILAGLEPSEDVTGGSWFSDGRLDIGLVDTISRVIEHYVSTQSWRLVEQDETGDRAQSPGQKRKRPAGGFDVHREEQAKAPKTAEGQSKGKAPKSYQSYAPGHLSYPTLRDITRHILNIKVTAASLPQNAILQLLQVMVYDDRLYKMHRPPNDDELPEDAVHNTVTMYRCFKTPAALAEQYQLDKRKVSTHDNVRKAAFRHQELEDIGPGGASEVPCLRCPVFDICGAGGPVNVITCKYFDEWYERLDEADKEREKEEAEEVAGDPGQEKKREKRKEKGATGKNKAETPMENGDFGPEVEVELEPL